MEQRDLYYSIRYAEESLGKVPTPWPTDQKIGITMRPLFNCRMWILNAALDESYSIEFRIYGGVDDYHIGKARALYCLLREARYGLMQLEDFAKIVEMDPDSHVTIYQHEMCKAQLQRARKLLMLDDSELTRFHKFVDKMTRFTMGDRDAFENH